MRIEDHPGAVRPPIDNARLTTGQWEIRCEVARRKGWPAVWGPKPGVFGCLVPIAVLHKFGLPLRPIPITHQAEAALAGAGALRTAKPLRLRDLVSPLPPLPIADDIGDFDIDDDSADLTPF